MVLASLAAAVVLFGLASRFYSRWLARQLGEDPSRPTPACRINDGRDYVPTKPYVVFAHHFSMIAGAGPILGPTMAIIYGFAPAWLWVVLGGIFIGAVHDFTALFVCTRERGRSLAEVARKTMGPAGFALFISFTILMLVLVTASFLNAVAISLTSQYPLDKLGLQADQTILHVIRDDQGVLMGRIGGIASMSVVVITAFSPLLGWLIYRRNFRAMFSYPLAAAVAALSILLGLHTPIFLDSRTWTIILSIYVFIAAGIPVWVILQPRDFINVQILYGGIFFLLAGVTICGFQGAQLIFPATNVAEGVKQLGLIWPMMFIQIACGAISGFHSLAAGGTTTKQIASECDARRIGFNAMLLESLLAVGVLLALALGLSFAEYKNIVYPDAAVRGNPILAFSLAVAHLLDRAFHLPTDLGTVFGVLMVEGFVITTLDAAIRLQRYLLEELWTIAFKNPPVILKNHWVNSGLAVLLMWLLAAGNRIEHLWPIFGASNQLLAALALITIMLWLIFARRRFFFVLAPTIFMILTTIASLLILLPRYFQQKKYVLVTMDILLLALAAGLIALLLVRLRGRFGQRSSDGRIC